MKNVKRFGGLLAVAMMMPIVAGCGQQTDDEVQSGSDAVQEVQEASQEATDEATEEAAEEATEENAAVPGDRNGDGKFTIGFANSMSSQEFFQAVQSSMEEACDANGVTLLSDWVENDAATQRELWDLFYTQGADIIVDFSIQPESGGTLAGQYLEKCPAISVDVAYDNTYFFGIDNHEAGLEMGKCMESKVKEKWDGEVDCAYVIYSDNATLEPRVMEGVNYMLQQGLIEEEEVEYYVYQNEDTAGVKALVQDFLTAHPDKHHIAIFAVQDVVGEGALKGVQAAQREDEVMIVSHNADAPAVSNFKLDEENSWVGSVNYNSARYGEQIVDLARRICSGEEVSEVTNAKISVTTHDNVWEEFPE